MANTYVQLYTQFVFAVKHRERLVNEEIREELQQYITGISKGIGQKLHAIYCMPDHTHILISKSADKSESEIMREIKSSSSQFINEKFGGRKKFEWQSGYGAFSYSKSHLDNVVNYILNQKEHHRKITFQEEYISFLKKFEIEYDERYLFQFLD